jgi:hypothetical protein
VLGRAVTMPEAPDLYINSRIDDITLDIAAFEPLVGAHGGLGGWQDRAVLLTPRALAAVLPAERIEGADRLHVVLVAMLRALGHRKSVQERGEVPDSAESLSFAGQERAAGQGRDAVSDQRPDPLTSAD